MEQRLKWQYGLCAIMPFMQDCSASKITIKNQITKLKNMKYTTLAFFFLTFLAQSYTQNINFTIANPQPVIQEVYGGRILSGDFDNDGDIDLVQSGIGLDINGLSASASVFLNDGNGNFTLQEQNFNNYWTTEEIVMSDFDNDDDLDLIITAENSSDLYLNDGQANFILENSSTLEAISSNEIIAGDVDGDGNIDVLQFGAPNTVLLPPIANLYINNGTGVFTQSQSTVFLPFREPTVEFIDLEGDGDLDILSFGKNDNNESQVGVYENDGTGNYSIFSTSNIAPHQSDEISVGDVDNDGDEDVLITGTTSDGTPKTILYLNNGAGQFNELMNTPFPDIFAGTSAFADLDNDNDLDILLTGSMAGGLPNIFSIVFENLGNNNFIAADSLGGEYIAERTIADLNGDGRKDIIIQGFVDDTNFYWNETIISSIKENYSIPFSVFPNPTNGQFQIEWGEEAISRIEVIDQNGKVIYNETINSQGLHHMNINLPKGIYILKMSGEKSISTQKIFLME